jgi:hypothetical protein
MLRLYASYGFCLTRTGHALKSMTTALKKARQLSLQHPIVEIRRLTPQGKEELVNTFVGGAPLVS